MSRTERSPIDFAMRHLESLRSFGLLDASQEVPGEARLVERRRAGAALEGVGVDRITLLERDGVFRWELGPTTRIADGLRRPAPQAASVHRLPRVILSLRTRRLEPSRVSAALEGVDRGLSGDVGWWRLDANAGRWVPWTGLEGQERRVLLLLHGAFVGHRSLVAGIDTSPSASAFWAWAHETYDDVVAFTHHTLRPTPFLNALEVERLLGGCRTVDIVAHSRGALVARWWLEVVSRGRASRAVLVGGPLGGTSLAAPDRLRLALGALTSIIHAAEAGGSVTPVVPAFGALAGILPLIAVVTGGASASPVLEAGVALVPGLASMSRVPNSLELQHLRDSDTKRGARYFVVRSNFEPRAGTWSFWQALRRPANVLGDDRAADWLFEGCNDLVVDTDSMSDFGSASRTPDKVLDFGTNERVHHFNYFAQPETLDWIVERLKA